MAYTKLFSTIVASSIWQEDLVTKVVWITMLAIKNRGHVVEASVPGLANLAGVERDECERALKKLMGPDADSRNKENEGRRIKEVPGGWLVLNGEYYQNVMGDEERKAKMAYYQRVHREREKQKKLSGVTIIQRGTVGQDGPIVTEIYDASKGEVAPPAADISTLKSEEVTY